MTPLRHSASPAVSGIAGAGSLPGVQAAVAGSSPAQFRPSDFDCGGVDSDTQAVKPEVLAASASGCEISRGQYRKGISPEQSRCNSGPQSPICPELTAYITTLVSVVGAIAWAHVFAMDLKLANQLINFHPRVMFCDAVGDRAGFLCAVRHKEGE